MRVSDYVVGELCAPDVQVLIELARKATRVLEYGAGGSTTIWSQFCDVGTIVHSVEPAEEWAKRTKEMIDKSDPHYDLYMKPRLMPIRYIAKDDEFLTSEAAPRWYDLIFLDSGTDRIALAERTWPLLMPTGAMAIHDAHTALGAEALAWTAKHHLEIEKIEFKSAVMLITKCVERMIGDTENYERRAPWESGHAPLPAWWPAKRGWLTSTDAAVRKAKLVIDLKEKGFSQEMAEQAVTALGTQIDRVKA